MEKIFEIRKPENCICEKVGSCQSCSLVDSALAFVRWRGLTLNQAVRKVIPHCRGERVRIEEDDVRKKSNNQGSLALGQRNNENLFRDGSENWSLKRLDFKRNREGR